MGPRRCALRSPGGTRGHGGRQRCLRTRSAGAVAEPRHAGRRVPGSPDQHRLRPAYPALGLHGGRPARLPDPTLQGTAASYSSTVGHTDKFFVQYFTRDCSTLSGLPDAQNCTTLTDAMIPRRGSPNAFGDPALRGMLQLGIRDYIVPGTARGPDASKMLTPVVLGFTKP